MNYAVVHTGGKQYRVQTGDLIDVELLSAESGDTIELKDVRLLAQEGQVKVGTPNVSGASVVAEVVEADFKGPKLVVFKYKAKTRYRKKAGHRQHYTRLRVTKIVAASVGLKPKAKAVAKTDQDAESLEL